GQLYPAWELCVAADRALVDDLRRRAKSDPRIRLAADEALTWGDKANAALAVAAGEFVVPLDAGDLLAEDALYRVAQAMTGADVIFSDEDKLEGRKRCEPWFKTDWNPALMLSCNAVGRLCAYRRELVQRLGGFRSNFAGAEEHDLVLRCARASEAGRIRHIPYVLYHRRGRPAQTLAAATARAVADYLAAQDVKAEVQTTPAGIQVSYPLPVTPPKVSILIATTARPEIIASCLSSLFERTSYPNWDVALLVNQNVRSMPERYRLLDDFARRPNAHVVEYADRPFNYSWVNNYGAAQATGDILCFLNDDTEAITPDWLQQLVARVSLSQVAAAGAMLYYPDDTIQHAGVVLGLSGVAGHACHGARRGSRGYFGRAVLEQDVSCVTAACMAIRADVFRAHGGFDETMPLAYNDVDLCLRLRGAGWRIVWLPTAELYHHESASFGRHDRGASSTQYARDVAVMRERWGSALAADPYYNPNLSLVHGYRLAFPPRGGAL